MTFRVKAEHQTGLIGPVCVLMGLALMLASPLARGGNRYVALIPLEICALLVLSCFVAKLSVHWVARREIGWSTGEWCALVLLASSPLIAAALQLTPMPAAWWAALPGRTAYAALLEQLGTAGTLRPLSLAPDATVASLLAGLPIVAAFGLGLLCSLGQLRIVLWCVVAMAFSQVLLGLMQIAGGEHSRLYFGMLSYGVPIGTFANRNHYANYLALALAGYCWLATRTLDTEDREGQPEGSFSTRHARLFWAAGALFLILGIVLSRSRGGLLFGVPAAAAGLLAATRRGGNWLAGWRTSALVAGAVLLAVLGIVGVDTATSRLTGDQLASSAGFRGALARSSLTAALAYWPTGAGWGTYDMVYPRFQPTEITGFANHAHQDYIELLLEGGLLFALLAAAFGYLLIRRLLALSGSARQHPGGHDAWRASAICGLGLLGFLLHSLVEFNMRIPANAMLAALLAGVYLRPMPIWHGPSQLDRPPQPHSSGH